MRVDTLKTDSFSMDYCQFGKGKETLVILPGISIQRVMGSAKSIENSYRLLADHFSVYVFERRNELPQVYTAKDIARDTATAIKALGLGAVNVFGASQGGMIAMNLAIDYPEMVRKLILGSTSAQETRGQRRKFEEWIQLAEEGDAEKLYLAFGEAVYPKTVFEQARNMLIEFSKAVTAEEINRFIILAKGMLGNDISKELNRISCPVLVIGDKEDLVMGEDSSMRIVKGIKNSKLFMYDHYGHAAYDLAPDYKERMLRFLTS